MIRRPSPTGRLYAWHRAALAGAEPERHDGLPECGWYKARLTKGGPWCAARIWIERDIDMATGELADDERYLCEVDGMRRDPAKVWLSLKPISKEEYDALLHRRAMIPAMHATMARIDLTQTIVRPE